MRFVKTRGNFLYQHPDNRLETVDPGSVVGLDDDVARQYVEAYGLGEYCSGPERLVRPGAEIERPGTDRRQAQAERAVAAPQAQRA